MSGSDALNSRRGDQQGGRPAGGTPAASAIEEFLRAQDAVPARSRWARFVGHSPLSEASRPRFWGALGELEVARALDELGAEWTLLYSVPESADGAGVDHVAIGPGGVFTIMTENTSGQSVWISGRTAIVSGHRQPFVRDVELGMGRAEALLSAATGSEVEVVGILALVDPETLAVRELPRDVVVLHSARLSRWLSRRPTVLDADSIQAMAQAAAGERHWRQHPPVIGEVAEQRVRFETLRRDVVRARLVRQLWLLTAALLVTGAIVAVGFAQLAAG
ncbi:nuclease-related domain-containing protein [Homoserinimonas aerilata]|nr:nuclease-related domain-containing protein [Homoserinimonas aerilata]